MKNITSMDCFKQFNHSAPELALEMVKLLPSSDQEKIMQAMAAGNPLQITLEMNSKGQPEITLNLKAENGLARLVTIPSTAPVIN